MGGQSQIQLARGNRVTVHSGITATATSTNQESRGHNSLILYANFTAGSGTWTIKIQGKSPDGAYIDMYDVNGNAMELSSITADKAQFFVGIPNDFKIVAEEDGDGATVTIGYELLSV